MRQLVIHAGFPKTGSSALQVALARHGDYLAEEGVHYPDLGSVAAAKSGAITSGNGASVAAFLNGNDKHQASIDACFGNITKAPQPTALLSSELFYSARPDRLAAFVERATAAGFGLRVVFFVRSLYEWAWSAYVQNVKNHGVSAQFADWIVSSRIGDAIPLTLAKFRTAVGAENILLLNYDVHRHDVFQALAKHGLSTSTPPPSTGEVGRINRSLSSTEIEALRMLNLIRQGRPGGKQLSDALITARPQLETPSAPEYPAALELIGGKYDAVRRATLDAVGGPVQLCETHAPDSIRIEDDRGEVDRIVNLLLYSHAIDAAALLHRIKDKLEGEGK